MDDIFQQLRQAIIDGMPSMAKVAAQRALADGVEPMLALNTACVPAMDYVGERFGCREMFLPDVLASSEAMKAAVAVLEPEMRKRGDRREVHGRVILGTVRGDIHEIGKGLVGILLGASGFEVHDLGVGVSPEVFAAKARELKADIVGVSALLTTTMNLQRDVVQRFDREGLRPAVKVIVGGAPVSQKWATEIGADGYGKDAMSAVALARNLMKKDRP
ncbi:MAG: corrinoid protein [Terriglobia bacterium]|nr:corrinoid protein [Terriglobia bacterium]